MCISNITANYSNFLKKCKDDEFICMVQKFSYTTSTENVTSSPKMWSLERKCTATCEAGCIVIGERTKLYACTSCCKTPYCNTDKGGATKLSTNPNNQLETLLISIFIMIITKLLASPMGYDCWLLLPGCHLSLPCVIVTALWNDWSVNIYSFIDKREGDSSSDMFWAARILSEKCIIWEKDIRFWHLIFAQLIKEQKVS